MAFADNERQPCLAIKIARDPVAETHLRHEWQVLNHFQGPNLSGIGKTLPQPILAEVVGAVYTLVSAAPSGHPICKSGSQTDDLKKVSNWLVELAQATHSIRAVAAVRQDLGCLFHQLGNTFDQLSDQEMKVVDGWIHQSMVGREVQQFDLFAVHGRLRQGNIWSKNGQLTVINWERCNLFGLPLEDLFTFITTYFFPSLERGPIELFLRAFRRIYLRETDQSKFVINLISDYCQALSIPTKSVLPRLGVFLVRCAIEESEQLSAAAERGFLPLLSYPENGKQPPFRLAIKNQLWINLLRLLIDRRQFFRSTIIHR